MDVKEVLGIRYFSPIILSSPFNIDVKVVLGICKTNTVGQYGNQCGIAHIYTYIPIQIYKYIQISIYTYINVFIYLYLYNMQYLIPNTIKERVKSLQRVCHEIGHVSGEEHVESFLDPQYMFYTWSGVREGKILGKRRPVNIGSVKFVSAITDEFSNKRNGGE